MSRVEKFQNSAGKFQKLAVKIDKKNLIFLHFVFAFLYKATANFHRQNSKN